MQQIRIRFSNIDGLSPCHKKGNKRKVCLVLVLTLVSLFLQLYLFKCLKLNEIQSSPNPCIHGDQNITKTSWQEGNLLDLKNFTWLRNNESLCKLHSAESSSNTKLLPVLISTSRANFKERLSIRRTWGSISLYKNWDVRLVFLLGQGNPTLQTQLEIEQQEQMLTEEEHKFGDIALGSFIDSYRNLTYKHLMGYKWILNFCSEATRVMKADDDLFVDMIQWLDWVTMDMEQRRGTKAPDIYCSVNLGGPPSREKGWKWFVTSEEWPGDTYPTYCHGVTYVIKLELLAKLYSVSKNMRFFWIDDVFVTGALMEEAKRMYAKNGMQLLWQPEIVDITYTRKYTTDFRKFMDMCDKKAWEEKRDFGIVAYLSRDWKYSDSWRMCLWNKTVYDYNKLVNYLKNKSELTVQ